MTSIGKLVTALVAVCCLVCVGAGAAMAAEVRGGATSVVAPGETVDDDLFAGGQQTVTISGHVTGDAYAAANTVFVNGTIDGDLIAAAQEVIVDGSVGGNVRAAGATVTINGSVGRSVTGLAQHLNITSNGHIGGSVTTAAESVDAFGQVGRGMTVAGETLQLAGSVGGPVLARVQNLSVAPTAHLGSSLDYRAKQEAAVPAGAVSGNVRFEPEPQPAPRPAPLLNGLFDLGGLIFLVGSFLLGAVCVVLMPRASARAAELGRQQPLQSFGIGFVALIGGPLVVLLVAITLVGLPLAMTLSAVYLVGLLLAMPAVGLVLGSQLMRTVRPARPMPVLASLALGLVVLHLLTHVPFVGPLVGICSVMLGLGLVVQAVRRWRRPTQLPQYAPPVPAAA